MLKNGEKGKLYIFYLSKEKKGKKQTNLSGGVTTYSQESMWNGVYIYIGVGIEEDIFVK